MSSTGQFAPRPDQPLFAGPVTMDRLLTVIVFAAIQFAALAVAVLCYGPARHWMTGGGYLSPAVRVPLVVVGVGLAELLVVAAVRPCSRITHRLWGRHC